MPIPELAIRRVLPASGLVLVSFDGLQPGMLEAVESTLAADVPFHP